MKEQTILVARSIALWKEYIELLDKIAGLKVISIVDTDIYSGAHFSAYFSPLYDDAIQKEVFENNRLKIEFLKDGNMRIVFEPLEEIYRRQFPGYSERIDVITDKMKARILVYSNKQKGYEQIFKLAQLVCADYVLLNLPPEASPLFEESELNRQDQAS